MKLAAAALFTTVAFGAEAAVISRRGDPEPVPYGPFGLSIESTVSGQKSMIHDGPFVVPSYGGNFPDYLVASENNFASYYIDQDHKLTYVNAKESVYAKFRKAQGTGRKYKPLCFTSEDIEDKEFIVPAFKIVDGYLRHQDDTDDTGFYACKHTGLIPSDIWTERTVIDHVINNNNKPFEGKCEQIKLLVVDGSGIIIPDEVVDED